MARKKKAPEFDADYDVEDDIVPGGGIPDDDGNVYLRRSVGKEKSSGKGKGKAGPAGTAPGQRVEDRPD